MIYLFEAIWCMIVILIKLCWRPALIFGTLAIIARLVGKAKREKAKAKKEAEAEEEEEA